MRRADEGETLKDTINSPGTSEDESSKKIEVLTDLICQGGGEAAAALLVLMATFQNAFDPKALANTVKHLAFIHCGELNVCGMVDAQIAVLEGELSAGNRLAA